MENQIEPENSASFVMYTLLNRIVLPIPVAKCMMPSRGLAVQHGNAPGKSQNRSRSSQLIDLLVQYWMLWPM